MNVIEHLLSQPRHVALFDAIGAMPAQQLGERAAALARALADALPPVRVLGVHADNGADWVVIDLAAQAAGIALVPLPAFFTRAQCEHAVQSSGMDALFAANPADEQELGFRGARAVPGVDTRLSRREVVATARLPERTAKLTFTSGTTGTPKGVCLDAAQQWRVAGALATALRDVPIERHLCLLPLPVLLENVAGIYAPMLRGAACCVLPLAEVGMKGAAAFDPLACLSAIGRCEAHSVILLPQMLSAIVEALAAGAAMPGCLRFAAVGGAKVSPALLSRARALGVPVYEGYGLSECGSVVALNVPGADRPGSVGRPLSHVRVRIVDGEIAVDGNAKPGHNANAAARGTGTPVFTGDLGRIDADGYLHVEGRRKQQLITSFGRNVAPEWPEAELVAGGSIAQAALFGEGRPALCAVLVPRSANVTDAALAADVNAANLRLPDYARVGRWMRADAPFHAGNGLATPNGRLRRDAILTRYAGRLDALYEPQRGDDAMPFFDSLQMRTAGARAELFEAPAIRDALAGRVTRERYLAFLAEAYHHVRHTVPLLMACGSRLAERCTWLREAVADYIDEERGHEQWILDDIAAAGGDAARVRDGVPAPATELMVAYVYDHVARRNPIGLFGMVHVLEGTSVALASRAAHVIQGTLGLPATALRYLRSHGQLDAEHVRFFADLMNRLESREDQEAVVHVATMVCRLYRGVFDSLPPYETPAAAEAA